MRGSNKCLTFGQQVRERLVITSGHFPHDKVALVYEEVHHCEGAESRNAKREEEGTCKAWVKVQGRSCSTLYRHVQGNGAAAGMPGAQQLHKQVSTRMTLQAFHLPCIQAA